MGQGDLGSPHTLADLPINVWLVGQQTPECQRQGCYSRPSVQGHPAKLLPELTRRVLETYTRPGEWVLDPMSGIGTTGVEAIRLGRHYVGIEVEERFVSWQCQNLEQARRKGASGQFTVDGADARRLDAAWGEHEAPELAGWGPVDAVVTSPPYEDRLGVRHLGVPSPFIQRLLQARRPLHRLLPGFYGAGRENIGNLKGQAYWEAMRHVYGGCHQVLRPGGWLVVVVRPGRMRQSLRPLHHATARLCQELGFDFIDEIVAVMSRVGVDAEGEVQLASHGFPWGRLAVARLREQGWPVTLGQVEYVLVFQKPDPDRGPHEGRPAPEGRTPVPSRALSRSNRQAVVQARVQTPTDARRAEIEG